jgi:NAD(P)-dependent dehydrogenase (short-subunit alcohol dehydrogenase family)
MGATCARRLGCGYRVMLADINEEMLRSVSNSMREDGYLVQTEVVDVARPEDVAALAAKVADLGWLKTLIDTAGVSQSMADSERVLAVDALGVAHVINAFEPIVTAGSVGIFIISMAANLLQLRPTPGWTTELEQKIASVGSAELLPVLRSVLSPEQRLVYWQAKRAAQVRVHAAAGRWGARGARIMTISPGIISTAMTTHELKRVTEMTRFLELCPLARMGTVEDIASAAQFIASDQASFMSGSDLLVDGGTIASLWAETALSGANAT